MEERIKRTVYMYRGFSTVDDRESSVIDRTKRKAIIDQDAADVMS